MDIAIYKFNSSTDTLPTFNSGYTYTYTDVNNGDGTITRTIASDILPTSINFIYQTDLLSLSYLDTSNVTSMQSMFEGCSSLISVDLSSFDTSNVTDMSYMFYNCKKITSIEGLNNFDTSNVTNMQSMFYFCNKLTSVDLSSFDTSEVINMQYMFYACNYITSLDLSSFNTSKVTNMEYMFYNCNRMTTLDLKGWDVSSVTDMNNILTSCSSLISINMDNSDVNSINKIIAQLPTKTSDNHGSLITGITQMQNCNVAAANKKYWNIKSNTIVKYRFNTAKSSNYRPVFDSTFSSYHSNGVNGIIHNYYYVEDEDEGNGIILRTIKATTDDIRPTQMRFGNKGNSTSNHALLEILEIDTSNLTTMSEMFAYCLGLTSLSILSSFDTSNVTDMSYMFDHIPNNLVIADYIRDWDTSKVTNMSYMFSNCSTLTSLNVSNWDTNKVINMSNMFLGCSALTSLDVSNWRVPNVEDLSYVFHGCTNLTSLDVSNWGVSKAYNTSRMFYLCNKLTELDLSSWHAPFLENMKEMFSYCNNLTRLNLCNWDLTYYQLQSNESMLYNVASVIQKIDLSNCSSITVNKIIQMLPSKKDYGNAGGLLVSEDVAKEIDNNALVESKNWSVIKTLIAEYVFDTNIDTHPNLGVIADLYGYWYTYEDTLNADSTTRKIYTYNTVMPAQILFQNCEGLLSLQYLNTSNLKNINSIFNRCTNLVSVNASDWDTSKVTDMIYAFRYCNKLTILDIANWDVSNVTRMYAMFQDCSSLTSLDLSNWDVGKVTDMNYMFSGCTNLTSLNLKYWNTKSVINMYLMFNNCSKLTSLDLSSFSTYNVIDMRNMFDNCKSLTTLYLNNWNMINVQYSSNLMPGSNYAKLNYVNVINSDENTVRTIQNYLPEKANLGDGALIIGDHIKRGITDSKNWKVFKQTVKKNTFTSSMLKYLLNSLKNKFALKSEVNKKVDKIENKVLSTNDYTDNDYERCKNILSDIELKYKSTTGYNYENYRTNMILSFNNMNEEYYTSVLIDPNTNNDFGVEIKDINKIKFTDINGIEFTPTLEGVEDDGYYTNYYYSYGSYRIIISLNSINKTFYIECLLPSLLEDGSTSRTVSDLSSFYIHIPKVAMVDIPFDKYRPSGLIVGCDTNFVCELDNEYRIYYKYASSIPYLYSSGEPYGKHTLVVEKTRVEDPNAPDTAETVLDFTDKLNDFVDIDDGYKTMDVLSLQGLNENTIKKVTIIANNESIIAERMFADDPNIIGYVATFDTFDALLALAYYIEEDKWVIEYHLPTDSTNEIVISELSVIIEQKNKYVIKEELEYDYKNIPNYYSYIPNEKDTDITMYFIDVNKVETGKTYLKPSFKNFVLVYEFNTAQALPIFNSGFTNYIINDKTKTNSVERTLTSNSIPSSVSFNNNQNLTKMIYMSGHISNISRAFNNCINLTESKVYGNQITNMSWTYKNCHNLTGPIFSGDNVINMTQTYENCFSLTGSPVCGPNVTDMNAAYRNCLSLTEPPVCGSNVIDMTAAYSGCYKMTGEPACGPNVTTMYQTYYGCSNLTGSPICGENVTDMYRTYYNCVNIGANAYFYSENITNTLECFGGRYDNRRLNLYVSNSGKTINTILHGENKASSLTGKDILYVYTNTGYEPYYVNAIQNVYIYPVENVAEIHDQHRRLIVSYIAKNSSIMPSTITTSYGNAGYSVNVVNDKLTLLRNDINAKVSYVSFNNNKNIYTILSLSNTITNMYNSFNNCRNLIGQPVCGDNVTNMAQAYYYCLNLTGNPVCGDNVVDFNSTYFYCQNITGFPVCGPNVTSLYQTYVRCYNLTGSPVCGNNVTDMYCTYSYCYNLTESPVCGNNVTNMSMTYEFCYNLTGQPVCGNNVTNMQCTYYNCINLTGQPVCGPNVTNMSQTYYNCRNLTGNPVCGNNVIDMTNTYSNCQNLTGSPVCGNNVIDMTNTYYRCYNLSGSPVCGPNVTTMLQTYYSCYNLTGSPVCGDDVISMSYTYSYCDNLTGQPVCGDKVKYMSGTYSNCQNLTGSPVCGPNVIDMSSTYISCDNLTGQPVCGDKVTNMSDAYRSCGNLTGSPVCGPNVTNMSDAYAWCTNLTGSSVCGDKVTDMYYTYYQCSNLTGSPVCGPNVTNMYYTYLNCTNLTGPVFVESKVNSMRNTYYGCTNLTGSNVYINSANVSTARGSFQYVNNLNIYVPENSMTFNTFSLSSSGQAIYEGGVYWTWNNTGNCYYNNSYNTYIIPVRNVVQLYKENELGIVTYITTNSNERPVLITGTTNGYGTSINGNQVKIYKNNAQDTITYISFKNSQTITKITDMIGDITDMRESFYNCRNLISVPKCGDKVFNMAYAYQNCVNLTGSAIIGNSVLNSRMTYANCTNISTNAYFFTNSISDIQGCFANKDVTKRLNIYVPKKGYTSFYNTYQLSLFTNEKSLVGQNITWTDDIATNGYHYNTAQNIYIYPVDDVHQLYKENELLITKYTMNSGADINPIIPRALTTDIVRNDSLNNTINNIRRDESYLITKFRRNFNEDFVSITYTSPRAFGSNISSSNIIITKEELLEEYNGEYYRLWENQMGIKIKLEEDYSIRVDIIHIASDNSVYTKVTTQSYEGYSFNEYTIEDTTTNGITTRYIYTDKENVFPPYISFENASDLLTVEKVRIEEMTSANYMFCNCSNLTSINTEGWDTSNIIYADYMFTNCSKLTKESFTNFELPNVKSASHIFDGCTNLQ